MGPLESPHQHGPPLLGRVRVPARSPTSSLVCSPPTPSVPSAAAPVVPCRRPTLAQGAGSTEGLPGCWAVLFQRAVVVDPVGCASLLAHHAETAVAFRLHEALGTQHERYFGAAMPTAHSLACLRIGDRVAARAARLATGVGGLTLHRTGFAPVGRQTKFRESPHHHSPSTSLAWSHRAPTPVRGATTAGSCSRSRARAPARQPGCSSCCSSPRGTRTRRAALRGEARQMGTRRSRRGSSASGLR